MKIGLGVLGFDIIYIYIYILVGILVILLKFKQVGSEFGLGFYQNPSPFWVF